MASDQGLYHVEAETSASEIEVYVLRDTQTGSEARIAPALGNNLFSFCVGLPGKAGPTQVMLAPTAPEELAQGLGFIAFGNPILFPYPNRVRNARYSFGGATHRLRAFPEGGHAIHGLVLDQPWKVMETQTTGGARLTSVFRWEDHPSVHEQYPFPFVFTVTYTLGGATIKMESRAQNVGQGRLPFGFGIHPYFRLPLSEDGRRQDCLIQVSASGQWELGPELLPTGRVVDVPAERDFRQLRPLGELALDDVYTRVERRGGWSECLLRDPAAELEVSVRADSSFRELVVYAPLERPTICFEPYTCTTDALNLQPRGIDAGLLVLEPGQEWRGVVEIGARTVSG